MVKLVVQFDDERSRVSLATPTCVPMGCCCCCCCLISTVATASISARNFQRLAEKEVPNESAKIRSARRFGFWQPLGLCVVVVVSALTFSFLGIPYVSDFLQYALLTIVGISYLILTTRAFKNDINVRGVVLRVIGFILLLVGLMAIEFMVGIGVIFNLHGKNWGREYLVVAIIIDVALIVWAFSKRIWPREQMRDSL